MGEMLCFACQEEGLGKCLIKELMENLQSRVPAQVTNDFELGKIQELNSEEGRIHAEARQRGCPHHNKFTLKLPRFDIE